MTIIFPPSEDRKCHGIVKALPGDYPWPPSKGWNGRSGVTLKHAAQTQFSPEISRVIGRRRGTEPAPTLIVVAALHGNEQAGVLGLRRFFAELESSGLEIAGEVIGLIGNIAASEAGRRFIETDLNRIWDRHRVLRLRSSERAELSEECELLDLVKQIDRSVSEARGQVYVIDLHTTSSYGPAFTVCSDLVANRRFSMAMPVPMVLGLEEEVPGTLLAHLSCFGHVTCGFEAGQHDDPASVDITVAAIWVAMDAAGILPASKVDGFADHLAVLDRARGDLPPAVEVCYRHGLEPNNSFAMRPGYRNFQSIAKLEVLADDADGAIQAPTGGRIFMPLYQSQGSDGFFIVRRFPRPLLWLSAKLRRVGAERVVHFLPGVRKHPDRPATYLVDLRIARYYALEIFHLLGFRRHGEVLDGWLTISRRD